MIRGDFIKRFKNHVNIGGKNHMHVVYVDAALVELFINNHIVNNTFYFDMQF